MRLIKYSVAPDSLYSDRSLQGDDFLTFSLYHCESNLNETERNETGLNKTKPSKISEIGHTKEES